MNHIAWFAFKNDLQRFDRGNRAMCRIRINNKNIRICIYDVVVIGIIIICILYKAARLNDFL